MQLTNNLRLPDAIVQAVANDDYTRGDADVSVTQLIAPTKLVHLRQRHDAELSEDVSMRLASVYGQLAHLLFERAAKLQALPGVLPEERFYIERNVGSRVVRISGQMDHVLVPDDGELTDYKFPSVSSLHWKLKYGMEEWIEQVNLYHLILAENDIDTKSARVVANGMGWVWSQADRDPTYPQSPTVSIPIELWPIEQTQAYLMRRLEAFLASETLDDADLPDCTRAERWETKTMYAVMSPTRKRAVRVVDTMVEAEMIRNGNDGWTIDTRLGVSKRCPRFCAAGRAGICDQWNAERARLEATGASTTSDETVEEPALS